MENDAANFLRRLIPFPGADALVPFSLVQVVSRAGGAPQDRLAEVAPANGTEQASAIVAHAASILDEEMEKGVLSARATAPQSYPNECHPALRQMHEVVDNLAALCPHLQGVTKVPPTQQLVSSPTEPLVTIRPPRPVQPGERTNISMTLRNRETRSVRLLPAATDLLGDRAGRIWNSALEFRPSEIVLEPGEQRDLEISVSIPVEAAAGCYSGLLVVKGLDYLRALIIIDVTSTTVGKPPSMRAAEPCSFAPSSIPSAVPPAVFSVRPYSGSIGAVRHASIMQEAIRLAEDGELGNSDAICLLQLPHRSEDVKKVLVRFEKQLTREAKSKLTLEAFVPLPDGVDNQRYEPIFERYAISGEIYTTAAGAAVLNEIQYYNGEMVQLYGECSNVGQVCKALEGSGYKPLMVRKTDGDKSAIAQFWSHNLTDTSLQPYNAAFIIVAAVPDNTPADKACISADENGASSALAMLDGAFDSATQLYENRVNLFFVRLLDSTQIAIDVGRERMGTDKRPGTIQLTRQGNQRSFSVKDGAGNPVAKIDFVIANDEKEYSSELARAAATAEIPLRSLPAGVEYVYPSAARIGSGPVMCWEWRTDVLPRLQRVNPNTAAFDSRSEEGEILIRWGFKPKVLGYIPNVRGVITGVR